MDHGFWQRVLSSPLVCLKETLFVPSLDWTQFGLLKRMHWQTRYMIR